MLPKSIDYHSIMKAVIKVVDAVIAHTVTASVFGLDPIRWTVWLRWLSLLLCPPFTKTIMGVGTV